MAKTKTATKADTKQAIAGEAPTGNLPAAVHEANEFRREMELRRRAFEPKLPPHVPWEKFQANIWTAIQNNPELLECNRATLWNACAEVAELGLSLNKSMREADIIPRWDSRLPSQPGSKYKGDKAAVLQIRYGGYEKLARQSGLVTSIRAVIVHKWDEFYHEEGANPVLEHKPQPKPAGYEKLPYWGVTHAYIVWTEVGNPKPRFEVVDLEDLLRVARRSDTYDKDRAAKGEGDHWKMAWNTDMTEMFKKTVMRRASKWMPQSTENNAFQKAVRLDDIRHSGGRAELRDGDVVDVTEFSQAAEEQPTPSAPQQSASSKSQVDDLESRMAGSQKPQAEQRPAQGQSSQAARGSGQAATAPTPPAQIVRLDVQKPVDRERWLTWLRLGEAAVKPLVPEQRKAWKEMHKDLLDACEFTAPDEMDALLKLLP